MYDFSKTGSGMSWPTPNVPKNSYYNPHPQPHHHTPYRPPPLHPAPPPYHPAVTEIPEMPDYFEQDNSNSHFPTPEGTTSLIDHIVNAVKNITQSPTIVEEGDAGAAAGGMTIIPPQPDGGIDLDETFNGVFNVARNITEEGNMMSNETLINFQPPIVEETVTEAAEMATEVVQKATETVAHTTEYIKDIFQMFTEEEPDYHQGGDMVPHKHHEEHMNTVYIILGVIIAVLVLVGIVLVFIYLYYKRRGFHEIHGSNKATLQKAQQPSTHTIEKEVIREDTWLKSSQKTKK